MFKTYMRLLGFVSPISKYAVPYFFYALLYALFNTLTYAMILPIMNTLFDDKNSYVFQPVYDFPMHGLSFSDIDASQMLSYVYTQLFGTNFTMSKMLLLLACGTIVMNLLSNFFRYMSAWTVENMRVRSLQRMRNDLFNKIMGMNAGYFSDQRKGDLMSRITQDVMVVQYCITNTLQVAFRDPLLIIGYVIYMLLVSWQLSLFAILFLPVVALIIGRIVKKLRHPALKGQERMGDMVSVLDESLSGIKVIKSYNATDYIRRKFSEFNAEFFAPDALDGPPPATSLADERIPRPDGRRGTDRLRRFARHERIAFGRRIRRLHRRILADHPPRALVHRPVRQHQSGYRRRRAHLRRARFRTGNPGQARRQDVGRPAREDRIPQCTLLLRRQPGGDRRHLVRHPARRNSGSGRSFGRRQIDPQRADPPASTTLRAATS